MDLHQQNILVTGSSRGIGSAIAQQLIAYGANVGLHYRNHLKGVKNLNQLHPKKTSIHQADLADDHSNAERLIDEFLQVWGKIDCLVLNAGVALPSPLNESMPDWQDNWDQTMAANLRGPAMLSKIVVPQMQKQAHGGRLVFISSRAAYRGDLPDYWAYAASKGGMVSLAKSIAKDFGYNNIKAFVVAPGFVQTEMARQFIDAYGKGFVLEDLSLNELTDPEDVANIVTFLASGMGDHATGTSIDVNAGSYLH